MKTITRLSLILISMSLTACSQEEPEKEKPALDSIDSQSSYAIGHSTGKSVNKNLSGLKASGVEVDFDVVIQGFTDGIRGSSQLDDETMKLAIQEFRNKVNDSRQKRLAKDKADREKSAAENIANGEKFLSENAKAEGVVTLESGLQYKILQAGNGKSAKLTDRVKVNYRGTLLDGSEFDSSFKRNKPSEFGVGGVIKGWQEGIPLMKEGAKWQFFIPSTLAYKNQARRNIPPGSTLIFEVELLEVIAMEAKEEKPEPEVKEGDK